MLCLEQYCVHRAPVRSRPSNNHVAFGTYHCSIKLRRPYLAKLTPVKTVTGPMFLLSEKDGSADVCSKHPLGLQISTTTDTAASALARHVTLMHCLHIELGQL